MLEYEKIKESLTIDDIIRIMDFLGAKEYQRNEFKGLLIFKTICHNVEADNGSLSFIIMKKIKNLYVILIALSLMIFLIYLKKE